MSSRLNSHFLLASVNEIISAWALGGTASLSLTACNGQATVGYNCTLGQPGAPHFSSPSLPPHPHPQPPPRRPGHLGPAKTEKNRQRAACHQASRTIPAPPSAPVYPASRPPTVSVSVAPSTAEDNKSLTDKPKLNEAEVQTEPGFVTVAVKEDI